MGKEFGLLVVSSEDPVHNIHQVLTCENDEEVDITT
jgi:hypothetical protein